MGSFSSLQGLLIWPAGLVLLYYRRRSLLQVGAWIVGALFAYFVYFYNYDDSQALDPQYADEHLFASLKFYLFAVGDVVGKPVGLGTSNPDNVLVILFGLLIVVVAVGTVLICGLRRDETFCESPRHRTHLLRTLVRRTHYTRSVFPGAGRSKLLSVYDIRYPHHRRHLPRTSRSPCRRHARTSDPVLGTTSSQPPSRRTPGSLEGGRIALPFPWLESCCWSSSRFRSHSESTMGCRVQESNTSSM